MELHASGCTPPPTDPSSGPYSERFLKPRTTLTDSLCQQSSDACGKFELGQRGCKTLLTLGALLELLSEVLLDGCGAVLNCARALWCHSQPRNRYGKQRTFFDAVLVPLRSLPPEPVYALWADARQIWRDVMYQGSRQCRALVYVIFISTGETD